MEESHTSEAIFQIGSNTVSVRQTPAGRYTISISGGRFRLQKKNLKGASASGLLLSCALPRSQIRVQKIKTAIRLVGAFGKATGLDWISLALTGLSAPIMLRAPALFRTAILLVEKSENPGHFTMRVVSQDSSYEGPTVEVTRATAEAAVRTFSPQQHAPDTNDRD